MTSYDAPRRNRREVMSAGDQRMPSGSPRSSTFSGIVIAAVTGSIDCYTALENLCRSEIIRRGDIPVSMAAFTATDVMHQITGTDGIKPGIVAVGCDVLMSVRV